MELVAHRAGNQPDTIAPAHEAAAVIEIDVHLFRGRLEVRHEKVIWPFARQWERWYLLPRGTRSPTFREIVEAIDPRTTLLIDLKGVSRRLPAAVRRELPSGRRAIVSSRAWWLLRAFRGVEGIRTLRSAGNRLQLGALRLVRHDAGTEGVVIHERLLSSMVIERLRRHTDLVFTWAVTDEGRALDLAGYGVTGLILDDLELLTTVRSRVEQAAGASAVDLPVE